MLPVSGCSGLGFDMFGLKLIYDRLMHSRLLGVEGLTEARLSRDQGRSWDYCTFIEWYWETVGEKGRVYSIRMQWTCK